MRQSWMEEQSLPPALLLLIFSASEVALEGSPVNYGARGPWSRASSSSASVDLQPVSTLQSPFSILFRLQLTQGARRSLLKKAWPRFILI
ncbi:hypothetical protein Q3G72_015580 [Acer saccharum]|nr:hypothetical protein Q3G72_015580 [Acer saccharum]